MKSSDHQCNLCAGKRAREGHLVSRPDNAKKKLILTQTKELCTISRYFLHSIKYKANVTRRIIQSIEEIQPEIIFEEFSYDGFGMIYSAGYQPPTVEAIAIKKYSQKHSIKHFPVDNYPINETDLLSDAQLIWDNSSEYRDLWNQKLLKLYQNRYYFINSNECIEILNKIRIVEETVLAETKNVKLLNEHKREKALHDKLENEMLRNIYNYSKQYPFDKAMFICGAEHRQPLKQRIKEYEAKENLKLKWIFYNDI